MEKELRTINLSKQFKDLKAVNEINLVVKPGEIVGLLGENGAGKTTTLRMVATLIRPSQGDVVVDGNSVLTDGGKVRKSIGILFGGEVGLYDRLTGRENISYFGQLNGMDKTEINKRIDELTELFSMEEFIDRKVGKFSRGMKQKIAIARSIVHSPDYMLFDEPTMGLDVSATAIVQDFIRKCKEQGKGILFSSHSMQEVEKLCDRVVIIHKGEVVEEGKIEDLKKSYETSDFENIFLRLVGGK